MADLQNPNFDSDNLNEAREASRALVDNFRELNKLGNDFSGQWSRDFLNNVRATSNVFGDVIAKLEEIEKLELSKREALNIEKKLREQTAKMASDLPGLEQRVENILKDRYDRSQKIAKARQKEYEDAVKSKGLYSAEAGAASLKLDKAKAINEKMKKAYELGIDSVNATKEQIKANEELAGKAKKYADNWNKANLTLGIVGKLMKGLSKIPIVGDVLNADKALKVMQKSILKGESAFKAFGKGASAALSSIDKSTVILAVIGAVVKAIQFFVSLIGRGQEITVGLSRELGISSDNAKALADRFRSINVAGGNILLNMKSASEAQGRLTQEFGATTYYSDELIDNQVLLNKNLGLSTETSAKLGSLFEFSGKGSRTVFNNVNNLNNAAAKVNGFLVPLPTLLNKMASAGAEVAGYFKFSATSLAQAVIETTKFGISLQQANTIAKGLLNFEESIGAQLELTLLTGKDFNFELARSKALQGDIAGASTEVLKQVQSLTDEQRQSPLIMESIAKATGLTAEQINEAYLKQTKLTTATKAYTEELRSQGKEELALLAEKYGIMGMTEEQIRKNVTTQEAFENALEKVKDQLTILDKSGSIEKLTKLLIDFVNTWSSQGIGAALGLPWWMGGGTDQEKLYDNSGINSVQSAQARLDDLAAKKLTGTGQYLEAVSDIEEMGYKVKDGQVINVDDFTISTNPKDTLVMAGGTRFGEETNAILREIVDELKRQDRIGQLGSWLSGDSISNAVGVLMGVRERGVN